MCAFISEYVSLFRCFPHHCTCSLTCVFWVQLVVGSEDFDLRVFHETDLLHEIAEGEVPATMSCVGNKRMHFAGYACLLNSAQLCTLTHLSVDSVVCLLVRGWINLIG
jgi:hypothetical protein